MIPALGIHLTCLKTLNRVYKCWVRPELQHDVIRRPGHCIITTSWDEMSWACNRLRTKVKIRKHISIEANKNFITTKYLKWIQFSLMYTDHNSLEKHYASWHTSFYEHLAVSYWVEFDRWPSSWTCWCGRAAASWAGHVMVS